MALPQLTDEQIETWTREQKDTWWLKNVYRGDLPQLTLRAGASGFVLGAVLASTNLYVGAKTGWSLGVGVTSVILAFALFKGLSAVGFKPFTILENNAVQSVATAAGYMTAPLVSSLSAYMVIVDKPLSAVQIFAWMAVNSVLGVLIAFPMKRRFVNDEQQPFPEGRACAVVLDSLYPHAPPGGSDPEAVRAAVDGHAIWLAQLKARALFGFAALAGFVEFLKLEGYQTLLQARLLGRAAEDVIRLPEQLFGWYYALAERNQWRLPSLFGTELRALGINPVLDLTMFGAGGLVGIRSATGLLVGCLVNWFFLAPLMIQAGEILPRADGSFGRAHILNTWSLWWGVGIMVAGSLASLLTKPELLLSSFRGLFGRGDTQKADPVAHIELPLWMSYVGVPVVGLVAVLMNTWWFGINPWLGLLALPLTIVLTLIAANSTALTGTTPTGSLSKVTQFTFGALDRANPATNLMTAGMTSEVASNAANLLMDIKPGYMLGAKPRQQAIGHVIGIVSGGIAATLLFFPLFIPHYDPALPFGEQLQARYPFPSVDLWRGVAELIATGAAELKRSALVAMAVAAAVGVALEVGRALTRGRIWLSPVAVGLGVVIPVDSTLMMFAGALFFMGMERYYRTKPRESLGHSLWVASPEPIAAGIVAGAALTGIGDQLITVFVLG